MPNENYHLRSLNLLKNKKIVKYDYAYREMIDNNEFTLEQEDQMFVKEARAKFFEFLKPYLRQVKDCIKDDFKLDNRKRACEFGCTNEQDLTTAVFSKYFDIDGYLEDFEEDDMPFVKRLSNSSQFQHFCDDYFLEDETTNYKMFFSIIDDSGTSEEEQRQKQKEWLMTKHGYSEEKAMGVLNSQNDAAAIGDGLDDGAS